MHKAKKDSGGKKGYELRLRQAIIHLGKRQKWDMSRGCKYLMGNSAAKGR